MRILLDECVPRPLKRELTDYEVRTVVQMGWSGKKNGELLQLMMQESFTILLTTDQNLLTISAKLATDWSCGRCSYSV
ncbi:MAG: hypothetical protein V7L25_13375 [Nostoc sp.]|uniref:hypothetical protein n=1 Tax=Nostoc sp. TaxID=1180 RepID=UPI002FF0AE62